jgi:hypothetical protein
MAVIQIGQNSGMLLGPLIFGWVVESGDGWLDGPDKAGRLPRTRRVPFSARSENGPHITTKWACGVKFVGAIHESPLRL